MKASEPQWKGTVMGAVLLLVLGLLFFGPMIAGDQILFPGHTATYLPWSDETPQEELELLRSLDNPLMGDKVRIFHPQQVFDKRSLGEGRLPLWDPYTLCGIPHLAQGLPALFSLLNMGYLFEKPERAYALTGLLQTVLGAIFMLLFLRSLEIRHFAATMGGFIFGFSGWMLVHLHYFMITGAAMWLPLLLLGTEKIIRGSRPWWIFALVIGSFQTLCAGFPQIAVFNLYIATIYALVRGMSLVRAQFKTACSRVLFIGAGIFLGILLSGIQLLPSAAVGLSDSTTRTMITKEEAKARSLEPACLLTFLAPDIFGHPDLIHRTESPYFKYSSLLSLAFLTQKSDMNYVEIQGYSGFLPLVLALLVFFARPRKGWIFFAITGAFSILLALGTPGLLDLITCFPGMLIGDIKRFLFPAVTCLSVLAAFTFDAFWKPGGVPRVQIVGFSILVILIVAVLAGWTWVTFSSEDTLRDTVASAIHSKTDLPETSILDNISDADLTVQREHIASTLRRTVLHMILAAVVLLLSTGWTRDWTISRPIIVAVLILDLFSVGWKFNKPMPGYPLYETANPVVEFLMQNTGQERILRFNNDGIYPVNTGSIHGVRDAQGYTAFYSSRYRTLMEILEPGVTHHYAVPSLRKRESLASLILDMASVKYILASEPLEVDGIAPVFHHKSVYIYENPDCLPRAFMVPTALQVQDSDDAMVKIRSGAFDPHEKVAIEGITEPVAQGEGGVFKPAALVSDQEDRVELDVTEGPGWLVLNDIYDTDWIAELDGEPVPIFPANLAFRAVKIPDASPHKVKFFYKPDSVKIGRLASIAGVCLCLMLIALFLVRSRGPRSGL
ncbi:MAG: YfhO family protein [Planctomycetota bacterium]